MKQRETPIFHETLYETESAFKAEKSTLKRLPSVFLCETKTTQNRRKQCFCFIYIYIGSKEKSAFMALVCGFCFIEALCFTPKIDETRIKLAENIKKVQLWKRTIV